MIRSDDILEMVALIKIKLVKISDIWNKFYFSYIWDKKKYNEKTWFKGW